jgi:hypothetical protein
VEHAHREGLSLLLWRVWDALLLLLLVRLLVRLLLQLVGLLLLGLWMGVKKTERGPFLQTLLPPS